MGSVGSPQSIRALNFRVQDEIAAKSATALWNALSARTALLSKPDHHEHKHFIENDLNIS
jgi:hypothetical protein